MFHTVKEVQPMQDYTLLVTFADSSKRVYDVKPLFDKWEQFQDFKQVQGLFERVSVDAGGYGISWNDDLDLACDELYHNGMIM